MRPLSAVGGLSVRNSLADFRRFDTRPQAVLPPKSD